MAYTFTSPQAPGLASAYALNANALLTGPYASSFPAGWGSWSGTPGFTGAMDATGVWYAPIVGPASASAGINTLMGGNSPAAGSRAFAGPGWYVVEASVYLVSGALTGAGVLVQLDSANYGTNYESFNLVFSTTPDVYGVVNGAGVAGTRYSYRTLFQCQNPLSVAANLYAMSHWSGFGVITGANQLNFYQASIRPATLAEVAAGNGQYGLPVFPLLPGQNITVSKAPRWSTKVKRATSGRERRTALWPYPLWQFEISFDVIRHRPTNDELAALWTFFNTVKGQYLPWLFLDPTDYANNDPIGASLEYPSPFGTGDGTTTAFQVQRYLGAANGFISSAAVLEPVYAPFGMQVFINGTPTTAYTMSANGQITFTTAPAGGAILTWEGYFYFGCRFLRDDMTFDQIVSQLWSGKSLKFTSLRP